MTFSLHQFVASACTAGLIFVAGCEQKPGAAPGGSGSGSAAHGSAAAQLSTEPHASPVVELGKSTPAAGSKSSTPSSRLVRASIAVEAWELVRKGRTR